MLVIVWTSARHARNSSGWEYAHYMINSTICRREGGVTNTAAALDSLETMFSEVNGDRPNVTNVALLVTDGHSADRLVCNISAKLKKWE